MKVHKGSKVSLDYEGKLEDGTVFDSSTHGDHNHPLEFEVGSGQVIQGFEEAIIGMDVGETKEFSIAPEKAYGKYQEALKRSFPKNQFPNTDKLQIGMQIMIGTPSGQQFPAIVGKISADTIMLDLNHPLAGKKLIFKIKVIDVK